MDRYHLPCLSRGLINLVKVWKKDYDSGSDKSLRLAGSNTKHINPKTHFITMTIQQVLISFKFLKINRLSKAGAENKYLDERKSNLCKKK
jgi:hypothetical protein